MSTPVIKISSITQLHMMLGLPKPKHPLISVMDAGELHVTEEQVGLKGSTDFYMISMKDKSCGMQYGRNTFDFAEGVMVFTAPGQVKELTEPVAKGEVNGWMLYFHQDLIRGTHLAEAIDDYSFFGYDVFEALHLSAEEEQTVLGCVEQIKREYEQRIDAHSQRVMVANLSLLLNHALRFYERQFHTRAQQSHSVVAAFEKELKKYFRKERHLEEGLPSIQFFAGKANLSQHYFSDLLRKQTGRSAKDHINDYVIEQAKNILVQSDRSISEVAYGLGFQYPHYFTRLFKAKTGLTPVQYRKAN